MEWGQGRARVNGKVRGRLRIEWDRERLDLEGVERALRGKPPQNFMGSRGISVAGPEQ